VRRRAGGQGCAGCQTAGLRFKQVVVTASGALLLESGGGFNPVKVRHLAPVAGALADLGRFAPRAQQRPYRSPVMHPTGKAFRAALEHGDHEKASQLLAPDVTFHSPIVHQTYSGRDEVAVILAAVAQVFEGFRYTAEYVSDDAGGGAVLAFAARVGDRDLEGVDIVRFGTEWPPCSPSPASGGWLSRRSSRRRSTGSRRAR
jgi:hypothetical protein